MVGFKHGRWWRKESRQISTLQPTRNLYCKPTELRRKSVDRESIYPFLVRLHRYSSMSPFARVNQFSLAPDRKLESLFKNGDLRGREVRNRWIRLPACFGYNYSLFMTAAKLVLQFPFPFPFPFSFKRGCGSGSEFFVELKLSHTWVLSLNMTSQTGLLHLHSFIMRHWRSLDSLYKDWLLPPISSFFLPSSTNIQTNRKQLQIKINHNYFLL